MQRVRTRFLVELGLAVLSGAILLLTLIRRDWVDVIVRIDPARGDSSLHWELQILALVATITFSVIARLEWIHDRDLSWMK